jgi:hypothetical protein
MPEEKKTALEITQGRMQRAWGIEPPGRKLVGLVLTPKNE